MPLIEQPVPDLSVSEQPTPVQPPGANILPSPPPSRKRLLLIISGGLIFLVLLAVIILSMLSHTADNAPVTKEGGTGNTDNQTIERDSRTPSVQQEPIPPSPTPLTAVSAGPTTVVVARNPEEAAVQFYTWYTSHPEPLTSGAYKTRPDITDRYKEIIDGYIERGLPDDFDVVFVCTDTPEKVVAMPAEYDPAQVLALVLLKEKDKNGRNLYQIKLQRERDTWLVRDVWCAP